MTARILRIEPRRSYYLGFTARIGWWGTYAPTGRLAGPPRPAGADGALVSSTPRLRRWQVIPTAAAMAIGAVAGYLGVLAAGRVLPYATFFPTGTLPIVAVGALSMVAATRSSGPCS